MTAPSLVQYNNLFAQNIQISNQFKDLIEEYRTKNTSINATVNSMIAKVNAVVKNMGSSIFRPTELFFDRTQIYSKSGLKVTADIKNTSQSNWVKVTSSLDAVDYPTVGSLTVLHPLRLYSIYGGYYESPRYATDRSRSQIQFIVSNYQSSSDDINCEIEKQKLSISAHGSWSVSARAIPIHTINITGLHPYKTLYARFRNINVPGKSGTYQEITKYGGNASFQIDKVCNYPEIKY